MKYGKLFKALIKASNEINVHTFDNLSSNRCSGLTYKELKAISHFMYNDMVESAKFLNIDNCLYMYMWQSKNVLAKNVYKAMKLIYG